MNELKKIRRSIWLLAFVSLGIAGAGLGLATMTWWARNLGLIAAIAEIWRLAHS
jgi:hypothetical protein